ncbi:MAG: DJ-1/PfpI family protein [Pseudomonadota bacterium]
MPELSPQTVAFLVFPNVTQLDLTGPAQVLSRLGNTKLDLVWKNTDPVPTDAGFPLLPTATFDEVKTANILCVPGGLGTMEIMQDPDVLNWVRTVAGKADWVTSVCTGSLVLAAAGLLEGYRAACHWASIDQLAYFNAIPVSERIVADRNRFTGGGVTSGIDFALALAARIRNEDFAKFIQLSIEYDPHPPFDSGTPDKAPPEILARYHKMIEQNVPDRAAKVKAIAQALGF